MRSDTIRKTLESRYFIITTDDLGNRTHKELDTLQDAYKYGLKLMKENTATHIELDIDIENNSDDSGSNVVKNETIYLK